MLRANTAPFPSIVAQISYLFCLARKLLTWFPGRSLYTSTHVYRIARLSGFIAHMDDMLFAFSHRVRVRSVPRVDDETTVHSTLSLLEKIFRERRFP